MADIQAFRGIRYDLGHVGSLADVIAPPYDVINEELQDSLYKKHPANVVRLILNRSEPGDGPDDKYKRAAKFLHHWIDEGVLVEENQPAIYVYHQIFEFGGTTYARRGFMARIRLERFGEGNIYPHEETHSAAKADRLKLTSHCKANLSQIFGIYPDPENEAQELLEQAAAGLTPLEATDHLGVVHRMRVVTDLQVIAKVAAVMGPKPIYIADGHHRYETACNYRDQLAEEGKLDVSHPANHVLMMCISMNDPGMIVLPTHRLFRGIPELSSQDLASKLKSCFDVETFDGEGESDSVADTLWSEIEVMGDQGSIGLYAAKDKQWLKATLNDQGRRKMEEIASDQSEDWRGLGVSLLHRLIVETLLEEKDLPAPKYVHAVDEVNNGIKQGDSTGRDATGQSGSGGQFNLASLVMPATLEHIRLISQHGERMPAKSTYFYPKLLSGMVINRLE